jgi:hypothetical protein
MSRPTKPKSAQPPRFAPRIPSENELPDSFKIAIAEAQARYKIWAKRTHKNALARHRRAIAREATEEAAWNARWSIGRARWEELCGQPLEDKS